MKASEAKLIADSTGCKGCAKLAEELELADEVVRDQQRKVRSARGIKREAHGKVAEQVRAIIAEWKRVYPEHVDKAAEPGSRRWQQIEARLNGGCKREDCLLAPAGAKTGGNAFIRKAGTDVRHIFCSESMVEELAALARGEKLSSYDGPQGVQAILDRLEGVKQARPDEWQTCCPAHEDRHASLRVGQGDKGAVVKCMAGCDTEKVLAAINLPMGALFDRDDAQVKITPPRKLAPLPSHEQLAAYQEALAASPVLLERLEAVRRWTLPTLKRLGVGWDAKRKRLIFPIRDAQGQLVQIVDYSPKPQNGQRKIDSLKGRPRELWPAPENFASEILLVEGEPDAISGHELGMPAVAIPGASTWKPAWPERFEGRRVLVCFDCDDEGRSAARRVFESLKPIVPYVRIVDLDVKRSDHFDLSDFLLAGGTAEQLRAPGLAVAA